jgi:HK97 family phage major capsid protein
MAKTDVDLDQIEAELDSPAKDTPKKPKMNKGVPDGAPNAIIGERGERAFSFSRFANSVTLANASDAWENSKVELDVAEKFEKALRKSGQMLQSADHSHGKRWLPTDLSKFSPALEHNSEAESDLRFIKAVMNAGIAKEMDPDEYNWMMRKGMFQKATTQQAYVDGYGGTLVAPPTMGEVIPLIRPKAACIEAGATQMTLPPSGRYVQPRITSAPTAQAVPENNSAQQSDMGTDQFQLTAKKIVGLVKFTDESSMFTNGTMDNWLRNELNRTLGLKIDAYAMYGLGGTNQPAGITNSIYSGANQVFDFVSNYPNARGVQPNGNIMFPEYADGFEGIIKERSFDVDVASAAYVMRPGVWSSIQAARADAVTPGDRAGPRVDILRKTGDKGAKRWDGRKVIESTNVSNTGAGASATKGTGTGLSDVFFGLWEAMVMATYGAVQFQDAYVGTDFNAGVKTLKATMYGDVGLRYPGAFLWYKQVAGLAFVF